VSRINDADLDRLADYTAGLLDPQEHRQVEQLVRTDPAWRQAHRALVDAQPRLDAGLAGLRDTPLPADVAARLDAALAGESGAADDGTVGGKVIHVRRWTRVAAWTGAAAAAVAAIFGGLLALQPQATNNATSGSRAAAPAPAAPSLYANAGSATVLHSGTDYSAQNLPGADGKTLPSGRTGADTPPRPDAQNAAPDGDLSRLNDQRALSACLAAIVSAYGGTPSVVDYAKFNGQPALVVTLVGPDGRRIVVVRPECGIAGAAAIYTTKS